MQCQANARWIERHMSTGGSWSAPKIIDARNLRMNNVDMDMYEKVRAAGAGRKGKQGLQDGLHEACMRLARGLHADKQRGRGH